MRKSIIECSVETQTEVGVVKFVAEGEIQIESEVESREGLFLEPPEGI